MNDKIYTIELLYQGKYESWDFKDPVARNDLFIKTKEEFSPYSLDEENDDIDDLAIVQLSASSLHVKEDGDVTQRVPYEWFEGRVFRDMLAFINENYNGLK